MSPQREFLNWNFNLAAGFPFQKRSESPVVKKKLLARYQAKRDFEKTSEPPGTKRVKASKRLRFIIQNTQPLTCTTISAWKSMVFSNLGR